MSVLWLWRIWWFLCVFVLLMMLCFGVFGRGMTTGTDQFLRFVMRESRSTRSGEVFGLFN